MTRVTRRKVLKAGTMLAGGMAGILATGRAPAFAQGTTVHWIRWNDFVPASDQLLRRELLPEAEKALEGRAGNPAEIEAVAQLVPKGVEANSDLHASAEYRAHLAVIYAGRAIAAALGRAA